MKEQTAASLPSWFSDGVVVSLHYITLLTIVSLLFKG